MKAKNLLLALSFLLIAFCLLPTISSAQNRDVLFTLEDRDRIIQIEEKLNSQQRQINDVKTELSAVKQEIKDVKQEILNLFYWGFGILIGFMMFLLGFIIWDRRTTVEPIKEHTQSLIQTLRDMAKAQPELADILRSHRLL